MLSCRHLPLLRNKFSGFSATWGKPVLQCEAALLTAGKPREGFAGCGGAAGEVGEC